MNDKIKIASVGPREVSSWARDIDFEHNGEVFSVVLHFNDWDGYSLDYSTTPNFPKEAIDSLDLWELEEAIETLESLQCKCGHGDCV